MSWARVPLGLVLLAMGLGKLSDVHGYAAALSAFDLVPDGARGVVAFAWSAAELGAGALLLLGGRAARAGGLLAIVINLGYALLTTQAYARHLAVANCTCFGVHLQQRLSWFVLLQDGYMIVYSVYVTIKCWRAVAGAAPSTPRSPAGSPARS